jgi:hypothetical protein
MGRTWNEVEGALARITDVRAEKKRALAKYKEIPLSLNPFII